MGSVLEAELGQKWGYGALKACVHEVVSNEKKLGLKGFLINNPRKCHLSWTQDSSGSRQWPTSCCHGLGLHLFSSQVFQQNLNYTVHCTHFCQKGGGTLIYSCI